MAVTGVLLLTGLLTVGDDSLVRLLGGKRRGRGGDKRIVINKRSGAVDRAPDNSGFRLIV